MRITLGVTDNAWAAFLREREDIDEANFWVPSARSFMGRATVDEPFLFKTKSPVNRLVGGGFYAGFWELRVSEAWSVFGEGNGCPDEATLNAAIQTYRERNKAPWEPDPTIGCLILRNLFFAEPGEEMPQPRRWGNSIVQGKTYDPSDPDFTYVDHAFQVLQSGIRLDPHWDSDLLLLTDERFQDHDGPRYSEPALTRHRLGQGSFRLRVLDAYGNRCAMSGNKMAPALEAAHIRPYTSGGRHLVTNGLALRSDLHRLYDRGYLGVDADYRLRVSPRLRTDFGNGVELYEREERGDLILLPTDDAARPDREALDWHMESVFRSA